MVEQSKWVKITEANPGHSAWFIERFRAKAAAGEDLAGEARFVDAIAPPNSRILDAGCGAGRIGVILAELGHDVVGVDVDPVLIAAAEQDHPGPKWLVGDLAELDLATEGIDERFDVIFSAGNVMPFLAPSTRREVLARLRDHLVNQGRVVVGFGAERGYEFNDFIADAEEAGLVVDFKMSTWDMRPLVADSDFLVTVLRAASVKPEASATSHQINP